jgi:hypothetical protein
MDYGGGAPESLSSDPSPHAGDATPARRSRRAPLANPPEHRLTNPHPLTESWWRDVWSSPPAAGFDDVNAEQLHQLVALVDEFWRSPTAELAEAIRVRRTSLGLDPQALRISR